MDSDYCPGFCGRVPLNGSGESQVYSECRPCPYGFRNVDNFKCEPCTQPLRTYDHSFLVFHAIVPLFINGIFIKIYAKADQRNRHRSIPTKWLFFQLLCAAGESAIGLVAAMLVFAPVGSLELYGCRRSRISEWYSLFQNPVINYTHTLRCSYEVVFPLFSLPFIIYAFCLAALIVLRSPLYFIANQLGTRLPSAPFYAALWTLPIMGAIHTILGGFIYHTFANLTVFTALLSNSIHLAMEGRKGVFDMVKHIVKNAETLILVIIHLLLFGYGIFTMYFTGPLTTFNWIVYLIFLLVLPVPVIFYVVTIRLTEPKQMRNRR